jgi:hypothetical protein
VMKSPGRVQTRFNWVKTWRSVCCNKARVEFSATLLRRQRREGNQARVKK